MATATLSSNRVNRESGIIRGVKVLGRVSANRREYGDKALQDVARLGEGILVNVDHVDSGVRRSYRDRIGRLENLQVHPDGVFGDLVVNKAHALSEQLFEDAEKSPRSVGLSIDCVGATTNVDGKLVVNSVTDLRSVDLVANPATTRGLFESVDLRESVSPFSDLLKGKSQTLATADRLDAVRRFTRPNSITDYER
jgi:hypothetical protein